MPDTVPEQPPNIEPIPTPAECAEAREMLADKTAGERVNFLYGYLAQGVRTYARDGFNADRNRFDLALVATFAQLQAEEADALATELAAERAAEQAAEQDGEAGS